MSLRQRILLTTVVLAIPVLACLLLLQRHTRRRAIEDGLTQAVLVHMLNGGRARCEALPQSWADAMHAPPMWGPHGPHGPMHQGHEPPPDDGAMPPPGPPGTPPGAPGAFGHGGSEGGFDWRPAEGAGPWRGPRFAMFDLAAYDTKFRSQNDHSPVIADTLRTAFGDKTSIFEHRGDSYMAIVRMPWTTGPCALIGVSGELPPPERIGLPPVELWLPPLLIALAAVTAALGPVLQRLQRLTQAVTKAPLELYANPIAVEGRDEISALARAFNSAGKEVHTHIAAQEQRERTLRNFLENTTHDVSIPLTVLQGYITQIQAHARKGTVTPAEVADAAMQEAHYIASLLHNLNVAAKLEAGEPHIRRERIDLNEVVRRAVGRHAPVAAKAGIELHHGVPEERLWVHADVTLVEQAVSNIIYNAIRYNKAGGHVAVTLDVPEPGRFHLIVTDDGPGIPEAQRQNITQRYARGNEARTRHPEGKGLGLSIAKRVCDLHGWGLSLGESSFGGLEVAFDSTLVD